MGRRPPRHGDPRARGCDHCFAGRDRHFCDPDTSTGGTAASLFGGIIAFDSVGLVLMSALGAGASRQTLVVSVTTQWGLFLPIAYLLVAVGGFGLLEIWIANAGYRLIQASLYTAMWRRGAWRTLKV